ncbi:MAG TPA: glutamate-1-semialdehyde 2,1-aminomutase [Syntrophales bacterium]|nr:glutamate-1-semialdehyde 2,1-aminomutase [Syntrophales bacterium]HON22952.1 glutamate-1-semialdehyde 2,1-aminomutase [Syntrophales bacterium]HOU78323.1 glutamate-1-semialdehyde 2,1-aminomutase [Syntrophales bacterium]HPC31529.1 glutamate-1-semialdehyde 2,1-aminomutase [Syntrophales bacterium]HQG34746.1 glutamate-1-semialdehyde 2,1-aminomutase [Syntrophales bacterium]
MEKSETLFARAGKLMPGGVNSPVRAFKAVGGAPLFMSSGRGSRICDVDGKEYVDYLMSWGPLILGHAPAAVVEAIKLQAEKGTSFGAPTPLEVELAGTIIEAFPAMEMIRMMSSGTEAVMTALRLARACTGREKIIKFAGCYHGHSDAMLVKAGSGVATLGIPDSPGVPAKLAGLTITLPFNDTGAVTAAFAAHGPDIAAVIVEPVAGNMGVVPPQPGFLLRLRELTAANGTLLIYDEVITGFRLAWGGYQGKDVIDPDLTCLGKIIGGGLPVGAVGGKRVVMEQLAPLGPVYQAGTLSGNPLAMAAGLTTLTLLKESRECYDVLNRYAFSLCEEMREMFSNKGIPVTINRVGSMFTVFFTPGPVIDLDTARRADTEIFARFFWGMLRNGVNPPPSQFEAWFVSLAHNLLDAEQTLEACKRTLETL